MVVTEMDDYSDFDIEEIAISDTGKLPEQGSVYEPLVGEHRISNSERGAYRRCRRRWNWSSRKGLIPRDREQKAALWFGSGFHFALEDYHGYHRYDEPADAFEAYVEAHTDEELPENPDDFINLAVGMLNHYTRYWLPKRNEFKTLWVDGVPQVEVEFRLPVLKQDYIGRDVPVTCRCHPDDGWPIYLVGTLDRVVVDTWGRIWIQDYKTAAQIRTAKLATDPQISTYSAAGRSLYGPDLEGVLLTQFRKAVPDWPERLKNGGFSQNKSQKTTAAMYVEALNKTFGGVPENYKAFVDYLDGQETEDGDMFIRQSTVRRNENQVAAEWDKIVDECSEMFDPYLRIYPNPTDRCDQDCAFREPCIALDDGSDWQGMLDSDFITRERVRESKWRQRLILPEPQVREQM